MSEHLRHPTLPSKVSSYYAAGSRMPQSTIQTEHFVEKENSYDANNTRTSKLPQTGSSSNLEQTNSYRPINFYHNPSSVTKQNNQEDTFNRVQMFSQGQALNAMLAGYSAEPYMQSLTNLNPTATWQPQSKNETMEFYSSDSANLNKMGIDYLG